MPRRRSALEFNENIATLTIRPGAKRRRRRRSSSCRRRPGSGCCTTWSPAKPDRRRRSTSSGVPDGSLARRHRLDCGRTRSPRPATSRSRTRRSISRTRSSLALIERGIRGSRHPGGASASREPSWRRSPRQRTRRIAIAAAARDRDDDDEGQPEPVRGDAAEGVGAAERRDGHGRAPAGRPRAEDLRRLGHPARQLRAGRRVGPVALRLRHRGDDRDAPRADAQGSSGITTRSSPRCRSPARTGRSRRG